MLATIARLVRPKPQAPRSPHPLLPPLLDAVGKAIVEVPDYEQRLNPSLNFAGAYFDREIAGIPGPLDISAEAHARDTLLAAVFPSADDIANALGRSVEVRDSLPTLARNGCKQVYALMGVRLKPGTGEDGEPPVLADHTLRSLAPSEADARRYLRLVAFCRLAKCFAEQVDKLRRANGREKIHGSDIAHFTPELAPENMLKGLVSWLDSPGAHFRVDSDGIELTPMPGDGRAPAYFRLPWLHSADRRQWAVCLVRFSTAEAQRAFDRETRTHRYIFI